MQKTILEIIDETILYYSTDTHRRAYDPDKHNCMYRTADDRRCAVGRCLEEKELGRFTDYVGDVFDLMYEFFRDEKEYRSPETLVQEPFKPEYRGYPLGFWSQLQNLHDGDKYWTTEGLSEEGQKRVELIKRRYAPKN
jgi:hypothetical protein